MSRLSMHLLGPFHTYLNGKPLENFKSNKARALLAFLAVESRHPHSRIKLAAMFWPEMPEADALANLRYTLSSLRQTLREKSTTKPVLCVDRETLQFNPLGDAWVDVTFFERQIAYAAELNPVQALPYLTAAGQCYQGNFMDGFYLSGCLNFDDWLLLTREKLTTRALGVLYTLAEFYEGRRQWENALTYTRKALDLAPWDEHLHQKAMCLLAQLGNPGAAWAQYQSCERLLARELQLPLSTETKALAMKIQAGERRTCQSSQPEPSVVVNERLCVARDAELAQLQDGLEAALHGDGQAIFISGQAGSGKTTLLDHFLSHALAAHPHLLAAWGNSSALSETFSLPFQPFRDILESLTGEFSSQRAIGLDIPEYAQRIWAALPTICQSLMENGADLLGTLLPANNLQTRIEAFTPPDTPWRLHLDEIVNQQQDRALISQEQVLAQITRLFQSLSDLHPLVLVFDDLQWADPASLNLLYHLEQRIQHHRVLVIGAYRPLRRTDDKTFSLVNVIRELQRRTGNLPVNLDRCDGRVFINAYLESHGYQVSAGFRENLYLQTGGQALFTVDTLRAMQESHKLTRGADGRWVESPSLDWQTIPSRVEAILAGDYDRLPAEVRPLLEIASLLGDVSASKVIALVAEMEETRVNRLLSELPGGEMAWLQVQLPEIIHEQISQSFRFRHRLYKEFVFQQIGPAERAALHSKAGSALVEIYENDPGEFAVQIAYHYEQAGQIEKAMPYFLQAARHASGLSAYEQSVALLTHALELLSSLPPSPRRDADELQFLNALSGQLMGGKGWGSDERLRATQRAYELCQRAGDATASQFLLTLFTLADMARARGQHTLSLALGQQMMQLAQARGEQAYVALSHWTLGATCFYQGKLKEARRHFETVVHLHIPGKENSLAAFTGTDASVVSLCWLSWVHSLEGDQEEAQARGAEAIAIANRMGHPLNQVFALTFGRCGVHALQRDWQTVLETVEQLLPLAQQDDLAPMLPWVLVFQGWSQTLSGKAAEGIERIRAGMDAWQQAGAISGLTCMGYYLADACLHAGRLAEAHTAVEEMLTLVEKTDERLFEPSLLRLKDELAG